ncbi:MAG: dipeptide epimerase [Sulfurimonas sp.]|nr:dipeptide epimerase [Sulfurimonas sp.]
MKIVSITPSLELISLKTPFITALRRVENIEFVRVVVRGDDGSTAIGEAPATKAITNEDTYDIMNSVWKMEKYLINQSLDECLSILHANSEIGSSAKASLDMAIVSLQAQERHQKLFEFLGCDEPVDLKTDITISLKPIHEMIEDARVALQAGMNILKIKLASDIKHAVNATKSIASLFPEAVLIIDANQAWSVEESLFFIEALKGVKIELIEQPVIAKDIMGLKEITEKSNIPILADEAVFTLGDAKKIIESKSADMINIKLMKCGGITKAVEILEYARKMNVQCMLGSMLEGPYSINAALHLALAYTDVIKYIDLDSPLLYKEVSNELDFAFEKNIISFLQ